ncbi:MAG: glutamine-hydrolyzing carbamoyl-phosphate synthase small subunit [Candidatus Omnitrophica bacterium]|nr:glutamine-hydrolyzing carbamoyl-phosphate synthase small subunit [Candidatus Omnitrophota bacterium]
MRAILVLEDGRTFWGQANIQTEQIGELIINTAVVGYQELITDPANIGKILVLTYPLIGNYGVASKFNLSERIWPAALVIKEKSRIYSNWQAQASLDEFAREHNFLILSEIDTRSLAVHLRHKGQMLGVISTQSTDVKELLSKIGDFSKEEKSQNYLSRVSVTEPKTMRRAKAKYRIAILDLGTTKDILEQLLTLGCSLYIFPHHTLPQQILKIRPQGLIISGGPEQVQGLNLIAEKLRPIIGKLPILGIATGHQVLALAFGARLKKMKLGHHGLNYPMARPHSYKAEITAQNHSWMVEPESLSSVRQIKITGYNLNDRSIEEMESKRFRFLAVQYYPVSPGFQETNPIFYQFLKMIKEN